MKKRERIRLKRMAKGLREVQKKHFEHSKWIQEEAETKVEREFKIALVELSYWIGALEEIAQNDHVKP